MVDRDSIHSKYINRVISGIRGKGRWNKPLRGKGDDEWCQGGQAGRDGLSEETSREPCVLYVCSVTTVETPWTVGFSVHEDSPNKNTGGVVISSPRESSQPRDRTSVSCVSCIVRWILYHEHHLGSPFQRAATSEVQPLAFASLSLPESLSLGKGCMC